jgi:autotransporter-associated beta strand protein
VLNVTGGSVNVGTALWVSNAGDGNTGTAAVTISGGTVNCNTLNIQIQRDKGDNVAVTVKTAGILDATNGIAFYHASTSTILTTAILTVNSGGLLSTTSITGAPNTTDANFSLALTGGTVQALGPNSNFISGFSTASVIGTNGITFDSNGNNITIAQNLSGSGSLNKINAGVLTLSGSNNYSGGTILSGGVVSLGSVNAISNTGTGNLSFNGGTLQFTGNNTKDYSSRISNSSGPISIDPNGFAISFGSAMTNSNSGGLTLTGVSGGSLLLSGSNGFAGLTNINNGVLALGNANALAGGGNIAFGGGTLQYSTSNTQDYSSRIAGSRGVIAIDANGQSVTFNNPLASSNSGGLTLTGVNGGMLTLNGNQNYTGPTLVNTGTLALSGGLVASTGASVAGGAVLSISGGTLAAGTLTLMNSATLSAQGSGATINAMTIGSASTDLVTLNETIGSGGTSIFKVTSSGGLTITGSALMNFAVAGSLTPNTDYPLISYSGSYSGNYQNLIPVFTGRTQGSIYNDIANHSIDVAITASAYPVWRGNISNVWDGSTNNWVLSNSTTTATSFINGSDNVLFDDTAGGTGAVTVNISGTETPAAISNGVWVNNTRAYTFTGAGNIAGGTGLLKTGTGLLTISSANTYSGGTDLAAGTLIIDNGTNGSAIGTGALTLNSGTLAAGPTSNMGSIGGLVTAGTGQHLIGPSIGLSSGYGTLNLNGGLTTSSKTTLFFQLGTTPSGGYYVGDLLNIGNGSALTIGASTSIALASNPAGGGDFRLIGISGAIVNGSLSNFVLPSVAGYNLSLSTTVDPNYIDLISTLAGPYTWTGNSGNGTWDTSSVNFKSAAPLTLPTAFVSGYAAIFDDSAGSNAGTISLSGTLAPASVTVSCNTAAYTFSGPGSITGTASLTMNGSGSLILDNSNSYSGGTHITNGLLQLGAPNVLPIAGAVTVNGGVLDLNGNGQTLPGLSGSGGIVTSSAGPATLALHLASGNVTFGGTFNNGGGLTLSTTGNGSQTLSGTASTLNELVAAGGTLAIVSPATVSINGTGDAIDFTGAASAPAVFTMNGGSLSMNNRWRIGHDPSGTGIAAITGGTISQTGSYIDIGFNGGRGLLTFGGSAMYNRGSNANIELRLGETFSTNSQAVVTGNATATFGPINVGYENLTSSNGYDILTVAQSGTLIGTSLNVGVSNTNTAALYSQYNQSGGTTTINGNIFLAGNMTSGTLTGAINLSGGALQTSGSITGGTGYSFLNLHGGTLAYTGTSQQSNFLNLGSNGTAFIYQGATINTGGQTLTLSTPLLSPNTGKGLTSIAVSSSGSGYLVPPAVSITGGGGSGATAVANVNASGAITGITITNPGTGYTGNPTVTLAGAIGTGAALGAVNVATNNYSGGLTITGGGTLISNAMNTYSGGTTIASGKLVLSPNGGLGDGPIVVQSGATFAPNPADGSGIVAGTSYASLSINAGATFNMSGDGAAGTFTVNGQSGAQSLTISGGTLGFDIGSSSSIPTDQLVVNGGSGTVAGTNVININPLFNVTTGTFGLITDAAGLGGAGTFTLSSTSVTLGSTTYLLSLQHSSSAESLIVASAGGSTSSGPANWNISTSGSWIGNNWTTPSPPNGQGAMAILGSSLLTSGTITLDGAQTVGTLTFSNSAASYTLSAGSGGSLTLDNTGGTGPAQILVLGGTHTIDSTVALTLANSSSLVSLTGGGNLTMAGSVLDGYSGSASLTLSSSDATGTLTLSGSNLFGGGTTVASGTLILDGASSLLAGSSLTIGNAPSSGGGVIIPQVLHATPSNLAPVPEPATLVLFAVCAVAMGLRVWQRRF